MSIPAHLIGAYNQAHQKLVDSGAQRLATALTEYEGRVNARIQLDPYLANDRLSFMLRSESVEVRQVVFEILLEGAQQGVQEARAELEVNGIAASTLAAAECSTWADNFSSVVLNGFYAQTARTLLETMSEWHRTKDRALNEQSGWRWLFSAGRAMAIAVTETTRALAQCKVRMYRSGGIGMYLIEGRGDKTCTCTNFIGQQFDIGSGVLPPFHPYCQCQIRLS